MQPGFKSASKHRARRGRNHIFRPVVFASASSPNKHETLLRLSRRTSAVKNSFPLSNAHITAGCRLRCVCGGVAGTGSPL